MELQVVILAAGMGTRLGRPLPKPLTRLDDGRSILGRQLDGVRAVLGDDAEVLVVVGFKLDVVMEAVPDVAFAYNELYDQTNTARSLQRALRVTGRRGVLWMNGDVVFDPAVLARVAEHAAAGESVVCVDRSAVGEEEVKYTVGEDGFVRRLGKDVHPAVGEAVGINYVAPTDKAALVRRLGEVRDTDYFERAVERAIERDGSRYRAVDITDLFAVEVDFEEDLVRANAGC